MGNDNCIEILSFLLFPYVKFLTFLRWEKHHKFLKRSLPFSRRTLKTKSLIEHQSLKTSPKSARSWLKLRNLATKRNFPERWITWPKPWAASWIGPRTDGEAWKMLRLWRTISMMPCKTCQKWFLKLKTNWIPSVHSERSLKRSRRRLRR